MATLMGFHEYLSLIYKISLRTAKNSKSFYNPALTLFVSFILNVYIKEYIAWWLERKHRNKPVIINEWFSPISTLKYFSTAVEHWLIGIISGIIHSTILGTPVFREKPTNGRKIKHLSPSSVIGNNIGFLLLKH